MGAPSKAAGGKRTPANAASGHPARGSAGSAARPPKSAERPPQGNGGYRSKVTRIPPRTEGPPRYTSKTVKSELLESAIAAARTRGYEALRIYDITDPVGVQRQAFYAHFRDKRHCLCEAIDPRLAVIERMAAAASEDRAGWSAEIIKSVDEVLYECFQSTEGTKGRLTAALRDLLGRKRSLSAVKIGELAKAAHVPQGDIYKHFSGKKECFALLYQQTLDQLVEEVETAVPPAGAEECPAEHTRHEVPVLLRTLGGVLIHDRQRTELLIVGLAELPAVRTGAQIGAWRGSFTEAVAELLGEQAPPILAASAVEIVRAALMSSSFDGLPADLADLGRIRGVAQSVPPADALAA